jgi:hypothetical protein
MFVCTHKQQSDDVDSVCNRITTQMVSLSYNLMSSIQQRIMVLMVDAPITMRRVLHTQMPANVHWLVDSAIREGYIHPSL